MKNVLLIFGLLITLYCFAQANHSLPPLSLNGSNSFILQRSNPSELTNTVINYAGDMNGDGSYLSNVLTTSNSLYWLLPQNELPLYSIQNKIY